MSKKVKKSNATEEVIENKTLETAQVELTETMTTENKETVAPEKTEEPKKEAKKTAKTTKKAAEKKATEKKASKVATKEAKETKTAPVEQIFVQYAGNEYATSMILANIKDAWVAAGHTVSSIKSLNVYVKPEENAAYYVINDKETGKVNL